MGREIDHNDRKNKVLAAAVSAYIDTGEPVSSKELAREFRLSPATLRNILAELEQEGYLFHPHTSAGRVPTDKGYRYYVDFLMAQHRLAQDQMELILNEYRRISHSLEEILEKTTEMTAALTNYTAVLSFSDDEDRVYYKGLSNIFQHPEFRDYQKLSLVVRMLEEKKRLLELINQQTDSHLHIYIGEEAHAPVRDIALIVTSYQSGKKHPGKLAIIGPKRMSYENTVSTLESMSDILNRVLESF
ncbi:MAG: HrcA family transcriptional regulator [Deltaproteobacteria bacterium]